MKKILGFRVKKLLGLGMVLCLLLALTACGKEENKENNGLTEVNPGAENSAGDDVSQAGNAADDETSTGTENGDGYFSEEYGEYFVGGITYKLDAATKTAAATGVYTLESSDVVMPDAIAYNGVDYVVTSAAESLLAYQESLTGVKLASGLTEIPASMFYGCENLTKVVIPEGVKKMQEAHPDVDIIIGALDDHLNEKGYIVPGLGDAGDRIFGTK